MNINLKIYPLSTDCLYIMLEIFDMSDMQGGDLRVTNEGKINI